MRFLKSILFDLVLLILGFLLAMLSIHLYDRGITDALHGYVVAYRILEMLIYFIYLTIIFIFSSNNLPTKVIDKIIEGVVIVGFCIFVILVAFIPGIIQTGFLSKIPLIEYVYNNASSIPVLVYVIPIAAFISRCIKKAS